MSDYSIQISQDKQRNAHEECCIERFFLFGGRKREQKQNGNRRDTPQGVVIKRLGEIERQRARARPRHSAAEAGQSCQVLYGARNIEYISAKDVQSQK